MRRTFMKPALVIIGSAILFASCQFGLAPETEDTDVTEFVNLFDTSYELELQGSLDPSASVASSGLFSSGGGLSSSATVPGDALSTAIPVGGSGTALNYPEPGLRTDFSVADADDPYLLITAVTTAMAGYEGSFLPERTVESYYVDDSMGRVPNEFDDGEVSAVGHPDSTINSAFGSLYREEFADYFSDGSVRQQFIAEAGGDGTDDDNDGTDDPFGYAAFDINGSMDVPSEVISGAGYTPVSDGSARFSSQVIYVHPLEETLNFWFLNDQIQNPTTVGVRYYTEHENSSGQVVGSSYALEIVYGTINSTVESIAQTVIRKEVVFASVGSSTAVSRQARMQMVIENQVAGENMVVGKNGKDISRLPPKAQEAQLRNILRDATSGTNTWEEIDGAWDEVNIQLQ